MNAATNKMPAFLPKEGGTAVTSTVSTENSTDISRLPGLVNAEDIQWPERSHASEYEKYDAMQVGQAVAPLTRAQSASIGNRLKKKGYKVISTKITADTYGLRRIG